jgi:hypothetical protein
MDAAALAAKSGHSRNPLPSGLRRRLHVLCLCLGAASSVLAEATPPSLTVEGRVLDVDRVPVAGASVEAGGRSTVTDEEGRFRLELPPAAVVLHVLAPA